MRKMKKSAIVITLAAMLAASSFAMAPGSPATIKASAYNENFGGTNEDVLKSVSPKGTIIKDKYYNLKYRVTKTFIPATGYRDNYSGKYVLSWNELPGEVEVVGHINSRKQSEDATTIQIGSEIPISDTDCPKLADGQEQRFIITGIAKNAFKNDNEDFFSITSTLGYTDKLVIPNGAFKNCKKLKKVQITGFESIEFKGKAFENAPIKEMTFWDGPDIFSPIKMKAPKNAFNKVKSNSIKVEVFMGDATPKKEVKKSATNIRSALVKGGIKKSKLHIEYEVDATRYKLK